MPTFIVRVVSATAGELHGEARHVATGEARRFASSHELLAFLEELAALAPGPAGGATPRASRSQRAKGGAERRRR